MKLKLLIWLLGAVALSSCQLNIHLSLNTPQKERPNKYSSVAYLKEIRTFQKKFNTSIPYENPLSFSPAPLQKLISRQDHFVLVRDSIISYAKTHLGVRYRSGGMSPQGFDCSGFTSYVMSYFGYKIPHASSAQALVGEAVDFENLQKGDLIFFGSPNRNGHYRVSHAALVCSEKGQPLAFIHAARSGIKVDDIKGSSWRCYYKKRYLFGKRLVKDGNTTDFIDRIVAFNNQ